MISIKNNGKTDKGADKLKQNRFFMIFHDVTNHKRGNEITAAGAFCKQMYKSSFYDSVINEVTKSPPQALFINKKEQQIIFFRHCL